MDGIRRGLARLAGQLGADRAYALLPGDDHDAGGRALRWMREGAGAVPPSGWPEAALAVCEHRAGPDGGRQRAVLVPRAAALPVGRERAALEAMGVRAWLCVPMRRPGGERIGFLGFERARFGGRRWHDEDAALLSTAGEIFAGALERERAAAEHEALEAELRRAQRMEAVGTLAGGIAHDFNNILGAIMGYAEMALEALPRGGRTREHVRQVWKAGERARGVIDQILAFSRRGDSERRPVRMRTVCEEAVDLLRASLPATVAIELHVEAAAAEATVHGDPGRLQLVVVNLCTNAAQAMDGQGVVGISLGAFEPEREVALSHGPPLGPGRYVRLAVADTGHGIDAATAERIFEPFFTTKEARGGTGLGLATAHGVVADHGGALHLRSRPGEGSTFEVYLPRAEAPPATADGSAAGAPVPRGHGEAVLLVDDERPLVLLGEEMLAALGYEPVGFDSASRALVAFRVDPGRFDIVLTDEVMPGMTGTSLAAELRQIRPDLPVVLMTGHAGSVRTDRLRASGIREVLRKPLASRTIAESLARHLRPEMAGGDAAGGGSLRAEA
jgi:signal transduction histidine kinase/ActR/RegA family two-component response regulator